MKKNKKTKNKKRYLLIISFIFLFLLSLLTINDFRKPTILEKTIKNTILFINQTVSYPIQLIKKSNQKKIEQVELDLENINKSEIDNLKKQIIELKQELGLKSVTSEYLYINATVINRNIGFWYNTVIIDKGSKDGVKPNMAVLSYSGLIGKIIKTTKNTSTIKLLTSNDENNKVSVQIKVDDGYLYGILTSFDPKMGEYTIEGVTGTNEIKKGSPISTTGMGNIFPSGILIGTVISIDKDNFDLEYIIKAKPSINVNNFNYVKVLGRDL